MQDDSAIMFEKLFAHSGLSLDRLRAFAEIVSAGGITAAAGDDSNRQSQLSRQLKELERYFGVELIKRGRGPMKLTLCGQQLHAIISQAFGALEEFRQHCADQPVELTIGAGESLIQWLLLPRMSKFASNHPRVNVTLQNLRTDEILDGLLDGSLDFGVVGRLKTNPALSSAALGKEDFGLFLPPGWRKGNPSQPPTASEILSEVPLATLHGSPTIREALEQEGRKHRLKLNIRMRFSSYPQLAQAVQSLKVAAVMPTLAACCFPAGNMEMVRLPFLDKLSRRLSLAWNRKQADVRPAVAKYSGILAEMFRQNVGQR